MLSGYPPLPVAISKDKEKAAGCCGAYAHTYDGSSGTQCTRLLCSAHHLHLG